MELQTWTAVSGLQWKSLFFYLKKTGNRGKKVQSTIDLWYFIDVTGKWPGLIRQRSISRLKLLSSAALFKLIFHFHRQQEQSDSPYDAFKIISAITQMMIEITGTTFFFKKAKILCN